ncbi:hypothetical protein BH10ACI1_BH10ACI1_03610 [soil metagenome]
MIQVAYHLRSIYEKRQVHLTNETVAVKVWSNQILTYIIW